MNTTDRTLVYVADPMCSWCWGFRPQLREIRAHLGTAVGFELVLGGLAPDTDDPMPAPTRQMIQQAWHTVADRTGAAFNWDFWVQCQPRRATHRACRAVLAATTLATATAGLQMFDAIQEAYYLKAQNPSDREPLIGLAQQLGLDPERFATELDGGAMRARLEQDLRFCQQTGLTGFPSLALRNGDRIRVIQQGWSPTATILERLIAEPPAE